MSDINDHDQGPGEPTIDHAHELYNRGIALAHLRKHDEAISVSHRAIDALRAANETGVPLAATLTNLATSLSAIGRTDEALRATQEAVNIFRQVAVSTPDNQAALASALANAGILFFQLGRRAEGLASTEEALKVRRELTPHDPDKYSGELAISLNNLGSALSSLGRANEALPVAQEAVAIRRQLADRDFDSYGLFLSRSLINLADILLELGHTTDALALAQESVDIRRVLAEANSELYEPDLADSLDKVCVILASLNRPADVVPLAQESLSLRRSLANFNADRYRADLARSLVNLGAAFSNLSQSSIALELAREAATIYRALAAKSTEVYTSDLALSLNNLGSILFELGRLSEALPHSNEAVRLRRGLAKTDVSRHRPDLAHSLVNLGAILSALGKTTEALRITRQAVEIYRDLAETDPQHYRSELERSTNALNLVEATRGRASTSYEDRPLPRWPIVKIIDPDVPGLAGPRVMTYTFRLPFQLGLADGGTYVIGTPGQWLDPEAAEIFGDSALVNIKLCNMGIAAEDPWPYHAPEVLQKLYKYDLPPPDESSTSADEAYEQWVTLETPDVRLDTDDPRDDGFAFHRCLEVWSRYLRAHYITFKDVRVRPATTHDLGPVVFRGAYSLQGEPEWHYLGAMIMHPDAYPANPAHSDPHESLDELLGAYRQLDIHPFLASAEWLRRAEYARKYSGDNTDVVVSLQISMESMVYRTWGMLLVDQGKTYTETIDDINSKAGYRQILTGILPSLLGGRWDLNALDTPTGRYWKRLYQLRNEIVHGGHRPSWPEAEAAYEAYVDMREFINQRLWANHKVYPRTLLVKIGDAGLQRRGWDSRWMREFSEKAKAEPGFFNLAYDLAGRPL